jgi:long-chain acyl-CoA synthetase
MSRGNLIGLLDAPSRWRAAEPAVVLGDSVLHTWASFTNAVAQCGSALRSRLGVQAGDAVALFAPNSAEYLELMFAVWHAGGVVVPISSRLHVREAAALLSASHARVCFVSGSLAAGLAPVAPSGCSLVVVEDELERLLVRGSPLEPVPRELGDDAWIFFTSGTTGTPKGARLSHGNLLAMAAAYYADVDAVGPRDALIHVAALSHASGLFALPFVGRGAVQVLPSSGGYDGEELAALIAAGERSTFFLPPTLLRRFVGVSGAHAVAGRIGTVIVGAAPVHADDLRSAISVLGPRLWNGYGQGESPCTITAMGKEAMAAALRAGDEQRLASVGVARWATRVRVVGSDGRELAAGESGEVVVDGPTVMSGYLDRPDETADTLRGGWLHTGDIGSFDSDGYLTLLDRSGDVVISGGYNVYPREVEDVLLTDPAVADAAVLGVPDDEWGERVVAFVVPSVAGAVAVDAQALDRRCIERIARHKRPREYHVLEALPRNAAGKVLKRELRASLAASSEAVW